MSKSTPIAQLPQQPVVTTPTDVVGDDDATIQEVLNQITGGGHNEPAPMKTTPQQHPPATMFPSQVNPMMHNMQQPPQPQQMNIDPTTAMLLNNLLQQQNTKQNNMFDGFVQLITDDIKIAGIILVGYIVMHFVPVSNILGRYFNLEKLPYADVVIKAVLLAALILVIRRFLS